MKILVLQKNHRRIHVLFLEIPSSRLPIAFKNLLQIPPELVYVLVYEVLFGKVSDQVVRFSHGVECRMSV